MRSFLPETQNKAYRATNNPKIIGNRRGKKFPERIFRLFYNWKTITGSAIISNTAIISNILNLVKTK